MAGFFRVFWGAGQPPATQLTVVADDTEQPEVHVEVQQLLDNAYQEKTEPEVLTANRRDAELISANRPRSHASTPAPALPLSLPTSRHATPDLVPPYTLRPIAVRPAQPLPGAKAAIAGAGAHAHAGAGAGPCTAAPWMLPTLYGLTNLSSVVLIVFANKIVLGSYRFHFPVMLTWLHTIATAAGMVASAALGMFPTKQVPLAKSLPMSAVYVAFIVFNNLSIRHNPVGFYQISKIAITPVVVAIEFFAYGRKASARVMASIVVLLLGIGLATVTDSEVSSNAVGMAIAAINIFVTGLYQVWAGTKQKELGLNGMQLLHQVAPPAVALLGILIPAMEPVGSPNVPNPNTILGYTLSSGALFWILLSSALGLVVTLSTFLFIGATSSLTYNVVGHLKTVAIVAGGVLIFGESMPWKKLMGVGFAMGGIIWYSHIKMEEAKKVEH